MRFRYAFQKIVDLKASEKTQAEWVLTQAIGKLRAEQTTLSELHSTKDELQEKLCQASAGTATISELKLLQSFVDHIDTRIHHKHRDVQEAENEVQLKQSDLNGKAMEEKVWSKARERAYVKFQAQVLKKEQERLDEMATNRYRQPS